MNHNTKRTLKGFWFRPCGSEEPLTGTPRCTKSREAHRMDRLMRELRHRADKVGAHKVPRSQYQAIQRELQTRDQARELFAAFGGGR